MSLSFEEYSDLIKDRVCTYCGGQLPRVETGLDRLDESKGYVLGNCVPCCCPCNDRLGEFTRVGFSRKRALELLKELNDNDRSKS
jgi:hypothetical protein